MTDQAFVTHFYESTVDRRTRLHDSNVRGGALCEIKSASQLVTTAVTKVTCPHCAELIVAGFSDDN